MLEARSIHTQRGNLNMLRLRSRQALMELGIDSPKKGPQIRGKYRYNGQRFQSSQFWKIVPP